jgi:ornithine cyclodeaminase
MTAPTIRTKAEIVAVLMRIPPSEIIAAMRSAFVAYSRHACSVPPVGHLAFDAPSGDVHVKSGYIAGDPFFVVKIASGFYENPTLGLSASSGVLLVFSARTGFLSTILVDESYLTDYRTAAAGAMVAELLAPKEIDAIGIVGTGVQAHLQLDLLRHVTRCRRALVWGRDRGKADAFSVDGFTITRAATVAGLASACNLIVTTTASANALLDAGDLRPGTHVTAVGADTPGKQELDPHIFARAAVRAVDSRAQCFDHGDAGHALRAGLVRTQDFVELGEVIAGAAPGRTAPEQITVADLTGVAVQDIAIARLVCDAFST